MAECKRYKVAAIDLGTVSSRLVLAQVEAGAIVESSKHTEITDLGEGVDATGRFCEAAVERVLAACRMFVDEARAFGAVRICTTCTSAARDASNAALLLDGLRELGLEPQVIPGEVEARLTFLAWHTTLLASASSSPIRAVAPRSSRRASMRLSAGSLRWRERAHWTSVAVA